MRDNGALSWLLSDHLGSTSVTASEAGEKIGEQRYKAFGETRYTAGELATSFSYTGQREEPGIGLYYYRARWYDPALGRFVQADTIVPPAGTPGALDRYAYVFNNPLRYTDPNGHTYCDSLWASREDCSDPQPKPTRSGYSSKESVKEAWSLVAGWFFERGEPVQEFGPSSPLTQDIKEDPGIDQFREAWAEAGYPVPWEWKHKADQREGGFIVTRIARGALVYFREHVVQLGLSTLGLGSKTAAGQIDPVGGTIGSLDVIRVFRAGDRLVRLEVYNEMGWLSGTRIPGTNRSILRNGERSEWGPGGIIAQYFYWWEPVPFRPYP